MTISRAPSKTWPIAAASIAATTISMSTSRVLLAQRLQPGERGLPPAGHVAGEVERPPDQPGPEQLAAAAGRKSSGRRAAHRTSDIAHRPQP